MLVASFGNATPFADEKIERDFVGHNRDLWQAFQSATRGGQEKGHALGLEFETVKLHRSKNRRLPGARIAKAREAVPVKPGEKLPKTIWVERA